MAAKDYWWILQPCAQGPKLSKYTLPHAVDPGVIRIHPADKGNEYSFDPSLELEASDYYILPPFAWWDKNKKLDTTWRSRVQAFMEFVVSSPAKLIPLMAEYGYVQQEYESTTYEKSSVAITNGAVAFLPGLTTPPAISATLKWEVTSPLFELESAPFSRFMDMACAMSPMFTITAKAIKEHGFTTEFTRALPDDDPAWNPLPTFPGTFSGFFDLTLDVPKWLQGVFSGHASVSMMYGFFFVLSTPFPGMVVNDTLRPREMPLAVIDPASSTFVFPCVANYNHNPYGVGQAFSVSVTFRVSADPLFTYCTSDRRYVSLKSTMGFKMLRTIAELKDSAAAAGKTITFKLSASAAQNSSAYNNNAVYLQGVPVLSVQALNDTIVVECERTNPTIVGTMSDVEIGLEVTTNAFELTDTTRVGIITQASATQDSVTYENISVAIPELFSVYALRSLRLLWTTGMCGMEIGGKVVPAIPYNATADDPVSEAFAYYHVGYNPTYNSYRRYFVGGGKATVAEGFQASFPKRCPNSARVSLYKGLVRTRQFMSSDPAWNSFDAAWLRAMLPARPLYVAYTNGLIRLHDAAEVARNGALTEANTILCISPVCRDGTPTKVEAGNQGLPGAGHYQGSKYLAVSLSAWVIGAFYGSAVPAHRIFRGGTSFLPDAGSVRGTADPVYPSYSDAPVTTDYFGGTVTWTYDRAIPPNYSGTDFVVGYRYGYSEATGEIALFLNAVLQWTGADRLGGKCSDLSGTVYAYGGFAANIYPGAGGVVVPSKSISDSKTTTIDWTPIPIHYYGLLKNNRAYVGGPEIAKVQYSHSNPGAITSISGSLHTDAAATCIISGANNYSESGAASLGLTNTAQADADTADIAYLPSYFTIVGPPTLSFSAAFSMGLNSNITVSGFSTMNAVASNDARSGAGGEGFYRKPNVDIPLQTETFDGLGTSGEPAYVTQRPFSIGISGNVSQTNTAFPPMRSDVGTPIGTLFAEAGSLFSTDRRYASPFQLPFTGFISHECPLFWQDFGDDADPNYAQFGKGQNANCFVALVGEECSIAHIGGRITKVLNKDTAVGRIENGKYKALRQGFDCIVAVDEANKLPVAIHVLALDPSKMATVIVGTTVGTSHMQIRSGGMQSLIPSVGERNPFGLEQISAGTQSPNEWAYTAMVAPLLGANYPAPGNSDWTVRGRWKFAAGVVDTSLISTKRTIRIRFKKLPEGWEPVIGTHLDGVAEQASSMFKLDERAKVYTLDLSGYTWDLPLLQKTTVLTRAHYWIGLRHQPTGIVVRASLPVATVFGPLDAAVFVPPNHPGGADRTTIPGGQSGPVI